jgi:hypothetical protein
MTGMSVTKDRLWLGLFALYVGILVFATVGEVFDIAWILDLVDLKKVFSV